MIVLAFVLSEIPAPATRLTLFVVPFSVNAPPLPPDAPTIVIVERLLFKVMFAPATKLTLPVEALRVKSAPLPPPPGGLKTLTL